MKVALVLIIVILIHDIFPTLSCWHDFSWPLCSLCFREGNAVIVSTERFCLTNRNGLNCRKLSQQWGFNNFIQV